MIDIGKKVFVFALIFVTHLPHDVLLYYQYPSVYWTPKNCRFNLNKPVGSAYEFRVRSFGKLYFICPNIALWNDMSNTGPQLSMMNENLMLVDKEGYETCTVNKTRDPRPNRMILRCDGDASKLKFTQETFSRHRVGSHRVPYYEGKTYYFISTSDGTKGSLDNLSGGHCKTHNMKLKITVCESEDECEYKMPECPLTDFSHGSTKYTQTTTSSTIAQSSTPTLPLKPVTKAAAVNKTKPTSQEQIKLKEEAQERKAKPITTRPVPKAGKQTSSDTIWGTERKHVIIHITMSLVIIVLSLSLVYVLVTRRKPKSKPIVFNSKLYQQRPVSVNDVSTGEV